MTVISVSSAQKNIHEIISNVNDYGTPVTIINDEDKKAVLIPEDYWNSIQETSYLYSIPGMVESIIEAGNEDLSECAKKITCPTLLIWGTNDEAAPIEEARELESLLSDGALIELPGCTHYAYLEALPQVINILNNFL